MSNLPQEMLNVDMAHDGMMALSITKGGDRTEIGLVNAAAGHVAALLLGMARDSFMKTIEKKEQVRKLPPGATGRLSLLPTKLGLCPSPRPDHESIAFEFGEAQIAFDIPRSELRGLGEAMIALSAGGNPQ